MMVREFLAMLDGVSGDARLRQWNARCPAHEDRNASLSVGVGDDDRILIQCFAGCAAQDVCAALELTTADLFANHAVGVSPALHPPNTNAATSALRTPLTVDSLAAAKGLRPEFLRALGVHDLANGGGVGIRYWDLDGSEVLKMRTTIAARDGSRWPARVPAMAYGLWLLAHHRTARRMLLVEGESDCWTAWLYGIPAIGIPGATACKAIRADMLADIDRIDVLEEQDNAGKQFVKNVHARLTALGWRGHTHVLRLPAKDLNALHVGRPQEFSQIVSAALADAPPVEHDARWTPPSPLTSPPPTTWALTPSMLPDALAPWLFDVATRMGCPVEFVVAGTLVALSAVIGRRVHIQPRRLDASFTVPANLWGAIVGEPSTKKTPALDAALQPIFDLEAAARRAFASQGGMLEIDRAAQRDARAHIEREVKRHLAAGTDPKQDAALVQRARDANRTLASPKRYTTTDTTVEQLCVLLEQNPFGILVQRDELSGWIAGFEKEGREQDRKFFLESWHGTGTYLVDRIGRPHVFVEALCVAIIGTIQPGLLGDLIRRAARGGQDRDGFIARFQILVVPDTTTEFAGIDRAPDQAAQHVVSGVFAGLSSAPPTALGAELKADGLPFFRFAADAQRVHDVWLEELRETIRRESDELLKAHFAKYESLMPRLALQYHLVDVVSQMSQPGPITAKAAMKAMQLTQLLEAHARRAYAMALTKQSDATGLLDKIAQGQVRHPFTERDVVRAGLHGPAARAAISALLESGHIRAQERPPGPGGGRPTTDYAIHPDFRRR